MIYSIMNSQETGEMRRQKKIRSNPQLLLFYKDLHFVHSWQLVFLCCMRSLNKMGSYLAEQKEVIMQKKDSSRVGQKAFLHKTFPRLIWKECFPTTALGYYPNSWLKSSCDFKRTITTCKRFSKNKTEYLFGIEREQSEHLFKSLPYFNPQLFHFSWK